MFRVCRGGVCLGSVAVAFVQGLSRWRLFRVCRGGVCLGFVAVAFV